MRTSLLVPIAALAVVTNLSLAGAAMGAGGNSHTESLSTFRATATPHTSTVGPDSGVHGAGRPGTTAGFDTVLTYSGSYTTASSPDYFGNPNTQWYYQFAGRAPAKGGTTTFNAPVMPVIVNLLNADGSIAYTEDPTPIVSQMMGSPIFTKADFSSSSRTTQFADAVMRATFYQTAPSNWHTMLSPTVIPTRTINVPSGSWVAILDGNGNLRGVKVDDNEFGALIFPPTSTGDDTTTPIGAAEHSGQMSTKDVTTLLFRDVFLYDGNPDNCCTLGYHSYDFENGTKQNGNRDRAYVMNYSSWVDPGIFQGTTFLDSGVLGHEMAETINDPLVATDQVPNTEVFFDETPWWLTSWGLCQANLEVGDVTEGQPTGGSTTVTTPSGTYHVPNVALLPWFASGSTPQSFNNQYSYPEPTLTSASVPQNAGCQ
jgi:hypothetical protein